jgi:hypothetical protein
MLTMATRPTHPKKEVEAAVRYAEAEGWTFRKMGHGDAYSVRMPTAMDALNR